MNTDTANAIELEHSEPEFDADMIRDEVDATDAGTEDVDENTLLLHRFLRRRAAAVAELARVKENNERIERALAGKVKGIDFVYQATVAAIVAQKIEGTKSKSVKTPWGVAGFRTVAAKVEVTDMDKFITTAPETLLRRKVEPNMVAISEVVKTSGEVPTGCVIRDAEERFYAK
jgi:hypothetical protein